MCGHFAAKGIRIHVVDESALAVDLDHGEPLPVARLQLGIAVDLDLSELEIDVLAELFENGTRASAEMASLCVIQDDLRDKYRE